MITNKTITMRTALAGSKSYILKALCLVVLMIVHSAPGFSQNVTRESIPDNDKDRVSVENLEETKSVDLDSLRSNFNSGNSYAEEFWQQTNKAYEEANKSLSNYAETYNETMGMVMEELDKWRGDYAYEYNETMGMVHKEMRKYSGTATPEESAGNFLLPRKDNLPGNRYGTDGLNRFGRSAGKDAILGPWELPEAPPPFHKFQPDLQPSF
jgi:hypothetical protein